MSALHDLIATQLSKVGMRAQDDVEDSDEWLEISAELEKAWKHLHGRRFERAAEHALTASRMTDKVLAKQ